MTGIRDGDRARIAYLLKQNLEEAEDFAMQWNLNPVSLEAIPPANSVYQQHAFFGLTKFAVNCGCSEAEYRKGLSATNSAVGNGGNARPLGQTVYWQQRATKLASKSIAVLTLLLCGLSSPAEAISDSPVVWCEFGYRRNIGAVFHTGTTTPSYCTIVRPPHSAWAKTVPQASIRGQHPPLWVEPGDTRRLIQPRGKWQRNAPWRNIGKHRHYRSPADFG